MANESSRLLLQRILEPVGRCFTADSAERLLELRADPCRGTRIDQLADKSTAGTLTTEERSEYQAFIAAATLIGILQAEGACHAGSPNRGVSEIEGQTPATRLRVPVDVGIANLVRDRAGNRCEYCQLGQADEPFARFHTEHIVPKQHGGGNETWNLALACNHCNFHKGTNLAGIDPETGAIVPLFNPRRDLRALHFEMRGIYVAGRTATGRTTVRVLNMNATPRLELRTELRASGRLS